MNVKTDILILGAGPAGMITASTASKYYPGKKIILMKNISKGVVPCGIPYMFYSLNDPEENKTGTQALEDKGIKVVCDEAVKIDRSLKMVSSLKGDEYIYEKLVIATGSKPIKPDIPGIDKKSVFFAYKDLDYLKIAVSEIKKKKKVLILGGGFIGVEFADEISKIKGVTVYLAEVMPHLLANSFDEEFAMLAENKLKDKGVNLLTGRKVVEISGKDDVEKARLDDGKEIDIDSVVMGIGAMPNTDLAFSSGLETGRGRSKAIWVDEYMRTSDPDIFAVGDCAGKKDFYTRRQVPVMLASTATAEARIAGASLYTLKVIRENKGTIAIYSTFLDGLVLGSAGLTETSAKKEGFEVVTGKASGMDKHPAGLPGSGKISIKLIFSKHSGILMGGQVSGGVSAGEIINIIGMAIQQRVTIPELETLQIATHPYLTAAPTMYPLVLAAQDASGKS